jgi:hypothetical protein
MMFIKKEDELSYLETLKTMQLIIMLRMLKLISFLQEVETLKIVIHTMNQMYNPLIGLGGILFIFFFVFALLGNFLFGGVITVTKPEITTNT